MKKQLKIFLSALTFYTRIPLPPGFYAHHNNESQSDGIRYLPVIGWLVGVIAGLVYVALYKVFNPEIALALSMVASIITTGAFHEDGFADTCDGFGGGWTRDKILAIMKDSRLGTYGVVGLTSILSLKYLSLKLLLTSEGVTENKVIILIFIVAHTLSRFSALALIFNLNYISSADSKSADATSASGKTNLYLAASFTLIPLIALICVMHNFSILYILIPSLLTVVCSIRYLKKWLNGYTGDCLGAVQQLAEVLIYMSLIIIWKYT